MQNLNYDRIIKTFKANEALLSIACKKDYNNDFNIKKCVEIIETIKKYNIKIPEFKSRVVLANGNPYLTLIICIYSLINDKELIINIQENVSNLNNQICEIFYNLFGIDEEIKVKFRIKAKMYLEEMINEAKNREIVVIDSKATYNKYKRLGFNPKYIPFFSIDLIYNDTKFEKLVESIFDYCESNFIEISVFENIRPDEYRLKVNKTFESDIIVILEEDITKDEIEELFKEKKVFINSNPFKNFEIECLNRKC